MSVSAAFVASDGLTAKLGEIDRQRARIDTLRLSRGDLWPFVLHKLKLRWTADSNAIEGSTMSFGETKFFIEQGLTVEGRPLKDFLDAKNHWEAIDLLFDVVAAKRPVTASLLKELNALILRGVGAVRPGDFKVQSNHVLQPDGTIHRYVEPIHVAAEIDALCATIEGPEAGVHPVVASALAHYGFVRIHPFDDGNGRGARILMNLLLLREGFPPAVVPLSSRRAYYEGLALADQGNIEPFVTFIVGCVHDTQANILSDLEA